MVDVPSAHERVTANATPADAMAWTNADSLVAEIKTDRVKKKRERERNRVCVSLVLNTDKAMFTPANIQTEVLKEKPPGGNLLTQQLFFEEAH